MITALHPPKTLYEVWKALPEGTMCQLIKNNLVMSPSPLDIHQVILNEINVELVFYVRKTKIGHVRVSPYDVHLSPINIFQPDICFIKEENKHLIKKNGLFGAPDIVIEILSPGTKKYDQTDKKEVYEQYGVQEYFLVEPSTRKVKSYFLQHGQFAEMEETVAILVSELLGTSIHF